MKTQIVDGLGKLGTASVVMFQNMIGTLPTYNYTAGQFEHCEDISGEVLYDTVLKRRDTCYACIVRCKREVEISEGAYQVDPYYGGPDMKPGNVWIVLRDKQFSCYLQSPSDMQYVRCGYNILRSNDSLCDGVFRERDHWIKRNLAEYRLSMGTRMPCWKCSTKLEIIRVPWG